MYQILGNDADPDSPFFYNIGTINKFLPIRKGKNGSGLTLASILPPPPPIWTIPLWTPQIGRKPIWNYALLLAQGKTIPPPPTPHTHTHTHGRETGVLLGFETCTKERHKAGIRRRSFYVNGAHGERVRTYLTYLLQPLKIPRRVVRLWNMTLSIRNEDSTLAAQRHANRTWIIVVEKGGKHQDKYVEDITKISVFLLVMTIFL